MVTCEMFTGKSRPVMRIAVGLFFYGWAALGLPAFAQDVAIPKMIRLVVPFSAGPGNDADARPLAPHRSTRPRRGGREGAARRFDAAAVVLHLPDLGGDDAQASVRRRDVLRADRDGGTEPLH